MEGTNAPLKVEVVACSLMALLLIATPTMADAVLPANLAARDLARCELDAERLYPAPANKGFENWPERRSNLEKQAQNIETCMRAAGYILADVCSAIQTCVRAASFILTAACAAVDDEVYRLCRSGSQSTDSDWNAHCLDTERLRAIDNRRSADCYQSYSRSRRWLRRLGVRDR
jgi:hypothetical protein